MPLKTPPRDLTSKQMKKSFDFGGSKSENSWERQSHNEVGIGGGGKRRGRAARDKNEEITNGRLWT